MGAKNIYERFVWFDNQVRARKYPNATSLAEQFEISAKTAQRDIDFDRQVKDGNHRAIQKSIEKVVEHENYEWQTLRVQEDGKIKVE
jgi:hydrogenase maturation factor